MFGVSIRTVPKGASPVLLLLFWLFVSSPVVKATQAVMLLPLLQARNHCSRSKFGGGSGSDLQPGGTLPGAVDFLAACFCRLLPGEGLEMRRLDGFAMFSLSRRRTRPVATVTDYEQRFTWISCFSRFACSCAGG